MFPPTESIMNLKVENIEPAGMVKAKVGGFKNSLVEAAKEPQVKEGENGRGSEATEGWSKATAAYRPPL